MAAVLWDRRMAEYDAFGRRVGESPPEQVEAPPAPAPSAQSNSRTFVVIVAAAVLVAAAAIAIAASMLVVTDNGTGGTASVASPVATGPQRGSETAPAATAQGLEPGSLLTEAALARAVRALRVTEYGRPLNLRVQADRIDARLVTRKGVMRSVEVGPDGVPHEQHAWQGGALPAMPWSAVDPAAPERLIRAVAEREGRSATDVNYLVLMSLPDPTWGLFFGDGMHYQGDAAGKILRRVSP